MLHPLIDIGQSANHKWEKIFIFKKNNIHYDYMSVSKKLSQLEIKLAQKLLKLSNQAFYAVSKVNSSSIYVFYKIPYSTFYKLPLTFQDFKTLSSASMNDEFVLLFVVLTSQ